MIFVYTLGAARIEVDGVRVTPASLRKFALLLHLSAEAGRRVSRNALQELIFPEKDASHAKHSLRELIYQLRQVGVEFAADSGSITLAPSSVHVDHVALTSDAFVDDAGVAAAAGGFLPGYAPDHSEAFSEWLDAYRARTTFDLSKALLREVGRAKGVGDWAATERASRACLVLDPLNEEATLALAEMLAIGGSKARAVRLLDGYMAEVSSPTRDLQLPAAVLKRRISESPRLGYSRDQLLPFRYRETEMMRLNELYAASLHRESQCAVIVGEPGIGKTRLAAHFADLAALRGAQVVRHASQPHNLHHPMAAFFELLPSLLQLPGALGCSPQAMNALMRLKGGTSSTMQRNTPHEVEAASHTVIKAIADLLDAVTAEAPLLILIEDAHWLDDLSLRTTLDLLVAEHPRRLFVLITTRNGSRLYKEAQFIDQISTFVLERLEPDASRQFAELALHGVDRASADTVRDWIAETSGGNPLFLITLAAHFRQTGEPFAVPASLRDLISRRLDTLGRQSLAMLQTCVILGNHSTLPRLIHCLQLPQFELLAATSELEQAHVAKLVDDRVIPAHPLIAEVLQDRSSSLFDRVARYRVAEVLQRDLDGGETALAWDCAELWALVGEDERAYHALCRCAAQAMEIGRARDATDILLKAASLRVSDALREQALTDGVHAARAGSEYDLVLSTVEKLRGVSPSSSHDDIELAELGAWAVTYRAGADFEQRAIACARCETATPEHRIRAALILTKYADGCSNAQLAMVVRDAIATLNHDAVDPAVCLEFEMVSQCAFGTPELARVAAIRFGESLAALPPARTASVELNRAIAFWRIGDTLSAIEAALRAHSAAVGCGAVRLAMTSSLQLADMYHAGGDSTEAHRWLAVAADAHQANPFIGEYELRVSQLDFALTDHLVADAQKLLREASAKQLFTGAIQKRWQRCFELRLMQLCGENIPYDDHASLAARRDGPAPLCGVRDFEIAVLCFDRIQVGATSDAHAVIADYLGRERRSPSLVAPVLRAAAADCDASIPATRRPWAAA
jgi:DNA-binding SARP family transcriptional activator/tetratricopeptide (TPR) repeat protein